jgi:hypothetical protein
VGCSRAHDRRGPIAFLPGGEAFTAGEGVVFVLTKQGTIRFLAGDADLPVTVMVMRVRHCWGGT